VGEKEVSIDFSELGRLEIECPNCYTGYVISFDPAHDSRLPLTCCDQRISDLAHEAVNNYRRFFANAQASKMSFHFRVKIA
jgi:hypothetical protein